MKKPDLFNFIARSYFLNKKKYTFYKVMIHVILAP